MNTQSEKKNILLKQINFLRNDNYMNFHYPRKILYFYSKTKKHMALVTKCMLLGVITAIFRMIFELN